MVIHNSKKKKPQIAVSIVLLLLSFVFLYPFWQTIVLSFSDKVYANSPGFKFWPPNWTLDAYRNVFKNNIIFVGYKNTLIRASVGTLLTLAVTFCAAYAMSHKSLPGYSIISFMIVFTMYFGGGQIPTYLNIKELGLTNTRWALILPMVASAWEFIIMRNFISSIGSELEEAAYIDGASSFQTMIRIILPLSKSVIAVVGLYSVVGHWNAWYDSLVYASKQHLIVLQTVVRQLLYEGEYSTASGEASMAETTSETIRAATVVIATLPVLAGYPFIQKYLVKGTMIGAVKG